MQALTMPLQPEGYTLFDQTELDALVQQQITRAHNAIAKTNTNDLLSIPAEDQVDMIVEQYQLVLPTLQMDHATQEEPEETTVERTLFGRDTRVPATRYTIIIPFMGHQGLFLCFPAMRDTNPPVAKLGEQELIIKIIGYDITLSDLDREIKKLKSRINQYLEWQRPQVDACNKEIRNSTRKDIEARKARVLQSRNIAASLPYPLKRRADAPPIYVSLRRKIVPVRPQAPVTAAYTPDPTIAEAEYQHILKVMSGMARMMERSPSTFGKLSEEEIRDFFLVVLNAHYEGKVTGETFNASGKTDILIREGDHNIFIGECKIWKGSKVLTSAIDQLLRYHTWRDTKSAVLLFSKNKDFTEVLTSIKETMEKHPHRKRGPTAEGETSFEYVFGNPNDHNREIIVTIMAFPILPASSTAVGTVKKA
jgi:hypothetical protein